MCLVAAQFGLLPTLSAVGRQFHLRHAAIAAERNSSDRTAAPRLTVVASVTLVKKERGTSRLTGTVLNPVSPGFTLAWGVSGTRTPTASK